MSKFYTGEHDKSPDAASQQGADEPRDEGYSIRPEDCHGLTGEQIRALTSPRDAAKWAKILGRQVQRQRGERDDEV